MNDAKQIVMVDLDGTLADCRHRAHMIDRDRDGGPDWRGYSLACPEDKPIPGALALVNLLYDLGCRIVLVSGRDSAATDRTIDWLAEYGVQFHELHLRAPKDRRPNEVVKASIAAAFGVPIALAIDDYPKAVDELTKWGVPALLVARDGVQ